MTRTLSLLICAGVVLVADVCRAGQDPEPRSIAAKCNKEAGGYYNPISKMWLLRSSMQIAAKNACVDRLSAERRR